MWCTNTRDDPQPLQKTALRRELSKNKAAAGRHWRVDRSRQILQGSLFQEARQGVNKSDPISKALASSSVQPHGAHTGSSSAPAKIQSLLPGEPRKKKAEIKECWKSGENPEEKIQRGTPLSLPCGISDWPMNHLCLERIRAVQLKVKCLSWEWRCCPRNEVGSPRLAERITCCRKVNNWRIGEYQNPECLEWMSVISKIQHTIIWHTKNQKDPMEHTLNVKENSVWPRDETDFGTDRQGF